MYPRGHRGVGALVMLLVLVLSAMALLPSRAQAQGNEITGLVTQCGSPTTVVVGALVTLADANGVRASQTASTAGDGTFSFSPNPSNYTISVSRSGFFSATTAQFRFDGTQTVTQDICLDGQPTAVYTLSMTVIVQGTGAVVTGNSSVSFYDSARLAAQESALVTSTVTNGTTGRATVALYGGSFELRVYANAYAPNITTMSVSASRTFTVNMTAGVTVVGHAKDPAGRFLSAGLVGWLYNLTAANNSGTKAISAVVSGSLYTFHAPPGSYRMIVDVNQYQAFETTLTLSLSTPTVSQDAVLQRSTTDAVRDEITTLFGPADWNNITVYRNLTLNADAPIPGLGPADLRDGRLQIVYTLSGVKSETLGASEQANFTAWVHRNGPVYTATDSFLLVNSKAFISDETSFRATVSDLTRPGKIWINSSATYTLKSTPYIAFGLSKYYVNVTMFPDTNTTGYVNRVYVVQLPRTYEVSEIPSTTPPVTTANFTRITLDPGVPSNPNTNPAVRMIVEKSVSGTARAKVTGPVGKFNVVNSSDKGYKAYVAANTSLNFSAQDSTDPVGDISKANFTWKMESNVSLAPQFTVYGIMPTFKYTTSGEYIVNLTVTQGGGNKTYRDITIWVDDQLPVARLKTNLTGTASANNGTLKINQGTIVKLDGILSTDLAYAGKANPILDGGYAWDFDQDGITDATGRTVNKTFTKVGNFFVNMTVTDSVGWKGVNATLHLQVNDTEAPKPAFDVLDPSNDYAVVLPTALVEKHAYVFNASKTTDNYEKGPNLTFNWMFPGPLVGFTGNEHPFPGVMNITVTWAEWNNSYAVKLNVSDRGFGSGTPNVGYLTKNVTVQVDTRIRPDTKIDANTLKIDNTNPEDGQRITVTVNVTAKTGKAAAGSLITRVYQVSGTQSLLLTETPVKWADKSGTDITAGNHTLAAGSTFTLTFEVVVQGQGNKTIKVLVYDRDEPYVWVSSENWAQQSIVVRQAGWVNFAIAGSVIGVFAVFIFAMYYRRKVKAGDWQSLRGRRGRREKGEGEERKPRREKEVKEEKKRL